MVEEGGRLREQAERVRAELLDTGDYAILEGNGEEGWGALVGVLYR